MATFNAAKSLRLGIFGLLFLVPICGAPRAVAQSQFFCWVAETPQSNPYAQEGQPAYFTALITARDKDSLAEGLFAQYVTKKYSIRHHGPPYCTQLTHCPQGCQSPVETDLQDRIGWVKRHGGTVIMTEWTPNKHEALMAEAAKNPAPASAAPAEKKAPPLAAQTAYEKAMAEQRPQSVSQAQIAAAAKQPAPAPNPNRRAAAPATVPASSQPSDANITEKYSFCYSTGNPPGRGSGQRHYYITQVFPATAGAARPENAFGAYIRAQHVQENMIGIFCTSPGPLSSAESARHTYIENHHKVPNLEVVELTWKPAS